MLLSYKLLSRYVDLDGITAYDVADMLTRCGLEVEEVKPLVFGSHLVVGRVETCDMHPDSDHLHITRVNIGDETLQIVCGAPNVSAGQHVIVAKVGAVLKDLTIKPTVIRGVESSGMICSLRELGIAEKYLTEAQKEGIAVLEDTHAGDDPRKALNLDDFTLDIKQTPNRSDFLSVFAIAHEVSALFKRALLLPDFAGIADQGRATNLSVSSKTNNASFFLGKVINHVRIAPSPVWIREALIASGIRPINNVVDISNLVMLETGQPLHFYDIDFLKQQELSVRDDLMIEVEGLDGELYQIENGDLVIMNGETPVGIAGVMGLGNSMIQNTSRGLIIEAARFDRNVVRKTSQRLGLSTDASLRFSKPYDAMATQNALDRAVQLLLEYADAAELEATAVYGESLGESLEVSVSADHVNRLLGTSLSEAEIMDVFARLYFKPEVKGGVIVCSIPSYRKDIEIAEDLIEEVIRVVGFDVLEETLPVMDLTVGTLSRNQRDIRHLEATLLGMGADQITSYTLTDIADTQGGESIGTAIALLSPMSDKRTHLRTQLLPSLLEVLRYNVSHKLKDILFFEISSLYAQEGSRQHLALIGSGNLFAQNWTQETIALDFFSLKGMLVSLLDSLGFTEKRLEFINDGYDTTQFHPYKSASIYLNRQRLGVIGHIHPQVQETYGLKDTVYAELDLSVLFENKRAAIKAQKIAKYPMVKRSLALQVDKDYPVKNLVQSIEKASRPLLASWEVFDVFTSEALGESKSLAFELTFAADRTLTDQEIQNVMQKISRELEEKHKITIR